MRYFLFCLMVMIAPAMAQNSFVNRDAVSQEYVDGALSVMASGIPTAASTTPPTDIDGGSVGVVTGQFMRPDAARPRITRAGVVTLDAGGLGTFSYASLPMAANAVAQLTPIYSGTGIPKCWVTAAASTTAVSVKCVLETATTLLNLSIITAGINLNINQGVVSGMQVNVVVLPKSP